MTDQGLNADVDRQMSALGLLSDYSVSEESSEGDIDTDNSASAKRKTSSKKKIKSRKSGLYKKSSDAVKYPQIWPHSALQYEFVSESVTFMSLDIKMFVAGDLEIILSLKTSAAERLGRLKLLKKMMYFENIYEWKALLKFYAAWVRRIKIGLSNWPGDTSEIETPMLARFPLRSKSFRKENYVKEQDQIWWCSDFNRQQCSFTTSSHQKNVKGHMRQVRHICGACYRADKLKLEHPESSSACPYKK